MQPDEQQPSGMPDPYLAAQPPAQGYLAQPVVQPSQPQWGGQPAHTAYPVQPQNPFSAPAQAAYVVTVGLPAGPYAPFYKRFFALFIDGFLVGAVLLAFALVGGTLATLMGMVTSGDLAAVGGILGILVLVPLAILTPLLYHVMLETGPNQATLGKQWMGLRVVKLDGQTISKGQCIIRFVVRIFLSGAFLGLGYFLALFTQHKQALHDLIANTVVVER